MCCRPDKIGDNKPGTLKGRMGQIKSKIRHVLYARFPLVYQLVRPTQRSPTQSNHKVITMVILRPINRVLLSYKYHVNYSLFKIKFKIDCKYYNNFAK